MGAHAAAGERPAPSLRAGARHPGVIALLVAVLVSIGVPLVLFMLLLVLTAAGLSLWSAWRSTCFSSSGS